MIINAVQEAVELEKMKPKIRKAKARQDKLEKNGTWVKVPGAFGNLRKFIPYGKDIQKDS